MKNFLPFCAVALIALSACKTTQNVKQQAKQAAEPAIQLDTISISPQSNEKLYHATETRIHDLIHTKLEVKFDYAKAELYGKAQLTLKPYFYPSNELVLDARGMELKSVSLMAATEEKPLTYTYRNDSLRIQLDKTYTRNDSYKIAIEYTARPNQLKKGGSAAINADKGLYFINPEGKEPYKPIQIWTQGETQSNSAWFPTIDRPNERMTHELFITLPKKYLSLSNGELISQMDVGDNLRTDYWKMEQPHAPYLVMMAIGEFAVVKDKWRDKEVSYFVEPNYEKDARAIFGNTPEMLEFFSKKLGVDFPWQKYAQVVVRDYVSGAMENTTATIHGQFVQRTKRELIDVSFEDVISHELFHQWFGDLVTCESWSNLPLNESFATYGEYLWNEYKYGLDEADMLQQQSNAGYFAESAQKQEDLIRFDYNDREDMFDGHSYNKGGAILHMLRRHLGDDAFFEGLKLYLETHKFQSVEAHDLRLAFEKVSGQDLNWFFNQWFFASGHPVLNVKHVSANNNYQLEVSQIQELKNTPLYKLPFTVKVDYADRSEMFQFLIAKPNQVFQIPVSGKPLNVSFDGDYSLLAQVTEDKPLDFWKHQLVSGKTFLERDQAFDFFMQSKSDSLHTLAIKAGLSDSFWGLRFQALNKFEQVPKALVPEFKPVLVSIAQNDKKSKNRAGALTQLANHFNDDAVVALLKKGSADSSYLVIGQSLKALSKLNPTEGLAAARQLKNPDSKDMILGLADLYADAGNDTDNEFFLKNFKYMDGFAKIGYINLYNKFLKRCEANTLKQGLSMVKSVAMDENKMIRFFGQNTLKDMQANIGNKLQLINNQLSQTTDAGKVAELQQLQLQLQQIERELKDALQASQGLEGK